MGKKRILIAASDRLLSIIGVSFLRRETFIVDTARSGAEALENVAACRPDLILLDYELEDMNGCEVCSRLKNDPDTSDIPVVVFSSGSSADAREKCMAAGCSAFLLRPIGREEIINVVEECLNETQRSLERISVSLPVSIYRSDRDDFAVVRSLSIGGAFVVMADPPRPGVRFKMSFTSLRLLIDTPIKVEVVWVGREPERGETGVGVKFLEMGYLERELLTRYVIKELKQEETCA